VSGSRISIGVDESGWMRPRGFFRTSRSTTSRRRAGARGRQQHDVRRPRAAELDYREPLEIGDAVEKVSADEGAALVVALRAGGRIKAVARVEAR
jgi:hypothetical protein